MKRLAVFTMIAGSVLILAQCSPKPHAAVSSSSEAPKAVAETKAKFSEEDIAAGKTIMEENCARCHKLKMPEDFTAAKLERVLPKMIGYAKLDENKGGQVRAYMLSHAKVE